MGKPRDFLMSHQEAADSYDEQQRLWEEQQHEMDLLGEDARDWNDEPQDEEEP